MNEPTESTPLNPVAAGSTDVDNMKPAFFWKWWGKLSTGSATVALACVNVFFFVQLQAVTYQVASNKTQISELQNRLQQQASKTEIVNEKIEEEHNLTVIHMAGTFVLLTCLITTFHMTAHLRKFNQPDVQRKIVAILWMSPIYAVTSFISLCIPQTDEYMMILKDFYEAYCIYQFLSFLIAVLGRGSRDTVVVVLAKRANHLKKPYRCLQCLFHPPPTESDHAKSKAVLLECQLLAMQFVFIKPLTSISSFLLYLLEEDSGQANDDMDDDQDPHFWKYLLSAKFLILLIENISVFFAFAGLLKFYHAVRDDLLWCQPFSKFLCIKGVVFLTFWQGMMISIIVNLNQKKSDDEDESKRLATMFQNLLVCLEMLFFSLAHFCVFPTDEWEEGYRPKQLHKPGMALEDFVRDVGLVFDHTTKGVRASKESTKQRKILSLDQQV